MAKTFSFFGIDDVITLNLFLETENHEYNDRELNKSSKRLFQTVIMVKTNSSGIIFFLLAANRFHT